ncbi:ROK family protein [Actinospica durhamensis]|uniref:ROK family protein n=1 Tax=Actinospica durhamensis TaxID=1508375 RepID=A0A941EU06_9ACTN|nr:ROK family protein [Actinospica durhamensis]MBR7836433.1 ROK family protein [Actinospica durhamensis]
MGTSTQNVGSVAAIDIGGTKIAGGVVDGSGRVLYATSCPTPAPPAPPVPPVSAATIQSASDDALHRAPDGISSAAAEVMAAVYAVLDDLAASPAWDGVDAVGIGSAGPVDVQNGTVSPVNIPAWRSFPLIAQTALHPAVGDRPLTLAGDAVAMAAGEHLYGAAAGHANALCMVVSTGVGGGLVLGGRVMPGATGNAGHIGHITVDLDGEPCPCGGRGCLERLASGPSIVRRALSFGWVPQATDTHGPDPRTDAPRSATLTHSAAAVAHSAAAGDRAALAAFDRAAQALAAGIAATAALVELDLVVIGGGVAQAGELLFAPLRAWLAQYATLAFTRHLTVVPARLGTHAGLVGAAACARSGAFPAHHPDTRAGESAVAWA